MKNVKLVNMSVLWIFTTLKTTSLFWERMYILISVTLIQAYFSKMHVISMKNSPDLLCQFSYFKYQFKNKFNISITPQTFTYAWRKLQTTIIHCPFLIFLKSFSLNWKAFSSHFHFPLNPIETTRWTRNQFTKSAWLTKFQSFSVKNVEDFFPFFSVFL